MPHGDIATDVDYSLQYLVRVCPDDLYCHVLAGIFSFPHICLATPINNIANSVGANRDPQDSWKKCMSATCPVQ